LTVVKIFLALWLSTKSTFLKEAKLEKRVYTEIELTNLISVIYHSNPGYNHTKIANHLFIEHKVAVSSRKVFHIIKELNKNNWQLQNTQGEKREAKRNIVSQKNPKWHRDEVILALDLYFNLKPNQISAKNPKIIQLSQILNSLQIHSKGSVSEKFRNPNGVALKITNFLFLDPKHPGKGMSAYSKLDKIIFDEFQFKRDSLHKIAKSIIYSIPLNSIDDQDYTNSANKETKSKETDNLGQKHELISHIFSDNIYKRFVKYCKRRGYKYLFDLKEFNFNRLYNIPGLGVKKINDIMAIYEKNKIKPEKKNIHRIISSQPVCHDIIDYLPLFSNYNVVERIVSYHPSYKINDPLENLNISPRSRHSLQILKLSTVGELLNMNPSQIKKIRNCGVKTITDLQEAMYTYLLVKDTDLSSSWLSFGTMIKSIINIPYRNLCIFKNRLGINQNSPQTLDESGSHFGLTRERTRQILSSIEKKLKTNINSKLLSPFWLAVDLVLDKYKGLVYSNDIAEEVTELLGWHTIIDGHAILEFSKMNNNYFIDDEYQVICIKNDNCLSCEFRENFLKDIAYSFDKFDLMDIKQAYFDSCCANCKFNNETKLLNEGQLKYQLHKMDFSKYYVYYRSLYYSHSKFEEIKKEEKRNQLRENHSVQVFFEDYLSSCPSYASQDDVQSFLNRNNIKMEYGIASLLQRSDDIYSWGRGLYIHKTKVHVSDDFKFELNNYLNLWFGKGNQYLAIQKVFTENEELCVEENVPNKIALYTVLSLSLSHCFKFPGYPLIAVEENSNILSLPDLIEDYIKTYDNGIEYSIVKKHLVEQIGISVRSFRFQISNNLNIIKKNNDVLIHKNYLINADEELHIFTFVEVLLSSRSLSIFAVNSHLNKVDLLKNINVSLDSIIVSDKNIESTNSLYSLNIGSKFYKQSYNFISKTLKDSNLDNNSISYLKSYLRSQQTQKNIESSNPLDNIIAEFG